MKEKNRQKNAYEKLEENDFIQNGGQIQNCKIPKHFLGYNSVKNWQ